MLLIKITKKGSVKSINKDDIDFIKKDKNISKLSSWKYNNFDYILYGRINGNAGDENKYDLPPPCDCELYFYDLYFIKYEGNNIIDLFLEDYNLFYAHCFEGFESIESTEDEIEEELSEHTSDRDFINDDDDISICSETNDIELSELSEFTTDENKKTTDEDKTDEDKTNTDDKKKEEEEISSIEITISSCSDNEDIDVDTE